MELADAIDFRIDEIEFLAGSWHCPVIYPFVQKFKLQK